MAVWPGRRSIVGGAGEMIADEALAALGMKALAVEGDDAGRLLAAVLQGVQAERDDRRRVGVAEDAEDAAFLVQAVLVQIDAGSAPRPASPASLLWRRRNRATVDQRVELLLVGQAMSRGPRPPVSSARPAGPAPGPASARL